MSEFVEFNLNEYIWVKLKESAIEELKNQHEELRKDIHNLPEWTPPEVDEDGYSKFQGWCLMNTFGHMMRPTMEPPFDLNVKFKAKGDNQ